MIEILAMIISLAATTNLDTRMVEVHHGEIFISGDRDSDCKLYSGRSGCLVHVDDIPGELCDRDTTIWGFDYPYAGLYSFSMEDCAIIFDVEKREISYQGSQRHIHDIYTDSSGDTYGSAGDDWTNGPQGNSMTLRLLSGSKEWEIYKLGQVHQYTSIVEFNGNLYGGSDNPADGARLYDIHNGGYTQIGELGTDVWTMKECGGTLYLGTVHERGGEVGLYSFDGSNIKSLWTKDVEARHGIWWLEVFGDSLYMYEQGGEITKIRGCE